MAGVTGVCGHAGDSSGYFLKGELRQHKLCLGKEVLALAWSMDGSSAESLRGHYHAKVPAREEVVGPIETPGPESEDLIPCPEDSGIKALPPFEHRAWS